jgi:hypothetical protein
MERSWTHSLLHRLSKAEHWALDGSVATRSMQREVPHTAVSGGAAFNAADSMGGKTGFVGGLAR